MCSLKNKDRPVDTESSLYQPYCAFFDRDIQRRFLAEPTGAMMAMAGVIFFMTTWNIFGFKRAISLWASIKMDLNLMDKLRLLRIDTELRPQIKMKPMNRYYFIANINPSEQFFAFVSTAAWLIRKTGKDFEQPNEEDDPNSTIAAILDVLREKEIAVDFSSHKLKQGSGEQVCYILSILADQVLKEQNFEWQKPVIDNMYDEEIVDDVDQVEDETEIILDKVEEEMAIYSDESEEENYEVKEKDETDFTGKVYDLEAWKLELERVAPALRVKISADGRDWRTRHAQMKTYKDELFDRFKTTAMQLTKLHSGITTTMDKVTARENILNEQFEGLIKEYGKMLSELNKANNEYKEASVGVTERQEALNEMTAKLEVIKQKTESKGSSMNDNSPLVSAKKAVAVLKKEIQEMDFQVIILLWMLTTKENPNYNNVLGNTQGLGADIET